MDSLRKKKVAKIESDYVLQREQQEHIYGKRRRGLIRRLTFYGICAAILSVLAAIMLISQAEALEKKNMEMERVESKLAQLKKDEKQLKEEIIKLEDDEYIAKLARKEYFLSEKGEIIFNLPEKDEDRD
ncbi:MULTISPECIES: FtsB family cell division protein [Bacillaceae]|uniref:Cell division protein DivIC n=1 Tax=Peribacillus huizhouensis TaxID=1501239 RepID=A0ABR6CW84_9BACI|nr:MULTISPECIES: septum formation initiator family protein [Bacillaceae]MBA9029284.1 cell division protein DivIC [Peribacillus huizhouensis]